MQYLWNRLHSTLFLQNKHCIVISIEFEKILIEKRLPIFEKIFGFTNKKLALIEEKFQILIRY